MHGLTGCIAYSSALTPLLVFRHTRPLGTQNIPCRYPPASVSQWRAVPIPSGLHHPEIIYHRPFGYRLAFPRSRLCFSSYSVGALPGSFCEFFFDYCCFVRIECLPRWSYCLENWDMSFFHMLCCSLSSESNIKPVKWNGFPGTVHNAQYAASLEL